MADIRDLVRNGLHLPVPLRDFHDQKDVFKSLHEWMRPAVDDDRKTALGALREMPSWINGQIYVIDYFLRFMAAHGWTLQRSRARVEFASLSDTIKERRDRDMKQFAETLANTRSTPAGRREPNDG